MPITTFNADYYDDYTLNNVSEKNYVKILFKPGYSVQVRELNQMQSMLQDQIHRLGSTLYTQDKAILGCRVNFIPTVYRVDFNLTLDENLDKATILENITSITSSSGLIASVLGYKDLEEEAGEPDSVRFYIKYINSGGTGDIKTFSENDIFDFALNTDSAPELAGYVIGANLIDETLSFASSISTEEGIFYVNGSFVALPKQVLFVDHSLESEVLTGIVAYRVDENVITYNEDETLLDNSAGTLNYTAPGADRYQIDMSLLWFSTNDWNSRDNTIQYVKVGEVKNSRLSENISTNSQQYLYNQIDKTLALRTQEESGNYTVNPFPLVLNDFYNGQNLPAKYMVAGNRYRIEAIGDATIAQWKAVGVSSTINVITPGIEFIATGALSSSGALVTETSFIRGRYNWNDLDLVPGYEDYYGAGSNDANKITAINRAKGSFLVTLDKSSGYVDGYRVFLDSPYDIETKKARTSETFPLSLNLSVGNYFKVTPSGSAFELPPIHNIDVTYEFRDAINGEGNIIGTCRVKSFEAAGGNEFLLYIFDENLNTGKSISDIASIRRSNFICNVVSDTTLSATTQKGLLYSLPYSECDPAVGVTGAFISSYRRFSGITSGTVISLVVGSELNETFDDTSSVIVYVGGTRVTSGISKTNDGKGLTIEGVTSGQSYSVIAAITTNTPATKKVLTVTTTNFSSSAAIANSSGALKVFVLPNTDIIEIISVINNRAGINYDVTPMFTLIHDGITDTYYTNGRVEYIGDGTLSGTFTIQYRYLSRIGGGALRYFSANSYSSISRQYIKNTTNGVSLRDTLDFRPDLLIGTERTGLLPNPNSTFKADAHYYLPRIDKVVVNSNNSFSVIEGTPSLFPNEPATPANSMCLYVLDVPAYTEDPSKIGVRYIDNRRYTMRDIAKLDKRIGNLEYYTSLSLLERSATEKSLFSGTEERFKNGIIVDNFLNHSIGDSSRKEHRCSIDKRRGVLRPGFRTHHIPLRYNTTDAQNIKIHSDTITLNYSEEQLFEQLVAVDSISVQPYLNAQTVGNISLYPSVDDWKDTETLPARVVEDDSAFRAIEELVKANPELIGYEYGEWTVTNVNTEIIGQNTVVTRQKGGGGVRNVTTTTQDILITTDELRTGTLTTLGSNTVERSLGESVTDVNLIPYMRGRVVWFFGSSFKPNTNLYAFFDDVAIGAYVAPKLTGDELLEYYEENVNGVNRVYRRWSNALLETGVSLFNNILPKDFPNPTGNGWQNFGTQIKSNDEGEVYGLFIVPNNEYLRFRTGEREFRLTSSDRNLQTADSYGMTKYTASGLAVQKQETILAIKEPEFVVTQVSETRSTPTTSTNTIQTFGNWYDPLAQSFVIDSKIYKEGLFLTSIDLFFETKGQKAPVSIYIVPTINGYPSQKVVPYSRVSVRSEDVNISSDASVATTFVFSNPVFLQADGEYAFIVESPDPDYKAWIAILGPNQTDVTTGLTYSKQEFLGVFFTSSNASTWTPHQERDLKFVMRRAEFVSAAGVIKFDGVAPIGIDTINIINGGSGYTSAPNVTIDPPPPRSPAVPTDRPAKGIAIVDTVTGAVTSIKITDKGAGYTTNVAPNVTIDAPPNGGIRATATASLYVRNYSLINCAQNLLVFDNTTVKSELVINNQTSTPIRLNRGEDSLIPIGLVNTFNNKFSVINPAIVTTTLTTGDRSISPVIDILKNSLIAVENVINSEANLFVTTNVNGNKFSRIGNVVTVNLESHGFNTGNNITISGTIQNTFSGIYTIEYVDKDTFKYTTTETGNITGSGTATITIDRETKSWGNRAEARYLTRPIALNDPADQLHIYIGINRPTATSNIRVYARALLLGGDDENIYDNDWTLLQSKKSSDLSINQSIPVNTNPEIYPEIAYVFDPAIDFTTFQVKIVMLSDNIIEIPTVKDFRAIASV